MARINNKQEYIRQRTYVSRLGYRFCWQKSFQWEASQKPDESSKQGRMQQLDKDERCVRDGSRSWYSNHRCEQFYEHKEDDKIRGSSEWLNNALENDIRLQKTGNQ